MRPGNLTHHLKENWSEAIDVVLLVKAKFNTTELPTFHKGELVIIRYACGDRLYNISLLF